MEPFGYFKAGPFGWTDCAETDEGAQPLFDQAAIDEIAKQRDELLAALERAETAMGICSDWMTEIEMPDGWTTTTDEKLKISAVIQAVKGGAS